MLNLFPIQFLSLFAYTILRVSVGLILVYLGFSHIQHRHELAERFTFQRLPFGLFFVWYLALAELIAGTLFILGLYTQIAALISLFLALKCMVMQRHFGGAWVPGRLFYFLLSSASLSLFITGGGFFGFDLPI